MTLKRFLFGILSSAAAVAVLTACGSPPAAATTAPQATTAPAAKTGAPYTIGFASDVTGGGTFLGDPEQKAAQMMVNRLQTSGGITGPDGVLHPVQIVIKDTQSNPDTAVSLAREFTDQDKAVALIMASTTPVGIAVASVAQESKVPYISLASSNAIITDPKTKAVLTWVFKDPQSNGDVAVWFARRAQKAGTKAAAYLYLNTGYGKDVFNNAKAALEKVGIKTVFSDSFEAADTQFPQMAGLKAANPDVVIVGGIPPGASLVTIAIRTALPNVPIWHGHGVCTADFIKLAGKAAEGVELPCSALIIAEDVPADSPQKQVFMDFKSTYEKTTGQPVSTFAGHAWDALNMSLDALKTLPDGLPLDQQRQKVRDYLETQIVKWPGTSGIFTMTASDHYGLTPDSFTWFKVQDGKFVPFPQDKW